MARRKKAGGGLGDLVDDFVEVAVDSIADKAREAFAARANRVRDLPSGQSFTCVGCNNTVQGAAVQFMRPAEGACICTSCFQFMFTAGIEKFRFIAKKAAAKATEKRAAAPLESPRADRTPPPIAPPWEVLGVSQEATEDEIGKAYRGIVMQWHPDRLPLEKRPEGQRRIDDATKAKNAMLSVRRAPTDKI